MPGVRLVGEPIFVISYNSVKDPNLLRAGATLTESSSDFDLKVFLKLSLVPVQLTICS